MQIEIAGVKCIEIYICVKTRQTLVNNAPRKTLRPFLDAESWMPWHSVPFQA